MSGAISITAAVIAIGTAVATEFATFAVIAAVGATISAVGAVTKVKELQYAGMAIGAVGLVGGLASAAGAFGSGGLFGEGGSLFSSASAATSAASDTVSWAAQAGTPAAESLAAFGASGAGEFAAAGANAATPGYASIDALMQAQGIGQASASAAGGTTDIINMVNGQPTVDVSEFTKVATSMSPEVMPEAAATTSMDDGISQFVADTGSPAAPTSAAPATPEVPGMSTEFGLGADAGGKGLLSTPPNQTANLDPVELAQSINGETGLPEAAGFPDNGANTTAASSSANGQGAQAPEPLNTPPPASATPADKVTGGVAQDNGLIVNGPAGGYTTESLKAAASTLPDGKSTWSGIMDFLKNNDKLVYGAMQTGGSFLSGAMSPLGPAQQKELDARARQNIAAANLYEEQQRLLERRRNNMSQPLPRMTRGGGGLINSVTGRV